MPPSSTSWQPARKNRNNNNNNKMTNASVHHVNLLTAKVAATLDLHGYTREVAMRRLTDFIETYDIGAVVVCVVTGTGKHSQSCGPVLKMAVEKLLVKRQMHFCKNGPGSFLVQANSGIVLYKKLRDEDTKLVIQQNSTTDQAFVSLQRVLHKQPVKSIKYNNNKTKSTNNSNFTVLNRPVYSKSNSITSSTTEDDTQSSTDTDYMFSLSQEPTLQQVVRDERHLEQALKASLAAQQAHLKTVKADQRELQKVMLESQRQYNNDTANNQDEWEKILDWSRREAQELQQREASHEETIQEIIALSKEQAEREQQVEELAIQKVLALSQQQQQQQDFGEDNDEDKVLQQILALSMLDL